MQEGKRLGSLVLNCMSVQKFLMPEGCRLTCDIFTISSEFPQLWQGPMRSVLGIAQSPETCVSRHLVGSSAN